MPILSTTKLIDKPGVGGGRILTEPLKVDLSKSTVPGDFVELIVSLSFTGIRYGGQENIMIYLTFTEDYDEDKSRVLHAFTKKSGDAYPEMFTCKVEVPKADGVVEMENILNVGPKCITDTREAQVEFTVQYQ